MRPRAATLAACALLLALALVMPAGMGGAPAQPEPVPPAVTPAPTPTQAPDPALAFRLELEGFARDFRALLRTSRGFDQQLEVVREEVREVRRLEDALLPAEQNVLRQLDLLLGRHGSAALSAQPFRQAVRFVVALVCLLVLSTLYKIRRSRLRGERPAATTDDPGGASGLARLAFFLLLLVGGLVLSALWDASVPLGSTEVADLRRLNDVHRQLVELDRQVGAISDRLARAIGEHQRLREMQDGVTQRYADLLRRSAMLSDQAPPASGGGLGTPEIVLMIGGVLGGVGAIGLVRATRRAARTRRSLGRGRDATAGGGTTPPGA